MTPPFPSASLAAGYVVACVLLAATPGADMAVFVSRTLRGGRAQGLAALAGAINGLLIHSDRRRGRLVGVARRIG